MLDSRDIFIRKLCSAQLLRTPDVVGYPWRRMLLVLLLPLPSFPSLHCVFAAVGVQWERAGEAWTHVCNALHIHEMVASSPEIICTARFKTALGRPLQANTTARCESWLGRITRALSIPHRKRGTFRQP